MDVDLWGWFHASHRQALLAGDTERQQLVTIYYDASASLETEPKRALTLLEQGKALAQKLGELCWTLFYDYWRCEAYMFYIDDYKTALDIAVRIAAEAHKPLYLRCPVRARVFRILTDAYVLIDPVGYADKIRETITYIENEIPMDDDTRLLLLGRRAILAFAFDNLDEAIEEGLKYLAVSEGHEYRYAYACGMLCDYYYLKGDLESALRYAQSAEICAHRMDMKALLASLAAWQALFARKKGDEDNAGRYYRLAASRMANLGRTPLSGYYDAMCDFFDAGEEPEKALKLREEELDIAVKSSSPYAECDSRIKRLRLMGRMGMPLDEELKIAREAGKQLINATLYFAKLDRIERGDYEGDFQSSK